MPKTVKICRVCGKKYEACGSEKRFSGVFQWRSVACSPECGKIYLERIRKSRGETIDEPSTEDIAVEQTVSDCPREEPKRGRPRKKKKQPEDDFDDPDDE